MTVPIPRTPRIANPAYHRSVGFDVLALGLAGLASSFVAPLRGWGMLPFFAVALATANRRRTLGAYEGDEGLVVCNYLSTRLVPWPSAVKVRVIRDPILPWLEVAAVATADGGSLSVSALRHMGEPTGDVLTLTRIVRERRDGLSREIWRDD